MTFALPRLAAAVLLLVPAVVVGTAGPASAAQDDLVSETFAESTVKDQNWRTGGNDRFKACLTASTAAGQTPVPGCATPQYGLPNGGDPAGSGALRITNTGGGQAGFALYDQARPFTAGVQVEFDYWSYGGRADVDQPGGDGLSLFLVDGTANLTRPGGAGGSLGYAQRGAEEPGVTKGFLGVGLDEYGNFLNREEGRGFGCDRTGGDPGRPIGTQWPNHVTLRGPGDGLDGYCVLDTKETQDLDVPGDGNVRTTPGVKRRVRFTVEPSTNSGPRVRLEIDFGSGYTEYLNAALPGDPPPTFKFGFAAGTGSATNVHEIGQIGIKTLEELPRLTIRKSHTGEFTSGGTGTFTLRPRVDDTGDAGVEKRPVTVTDTLPEGMTVNAVPTGTGWDCSRTTAGSRTVRCVYDVKMEAPIAAGTDLPPITLPVRVGRGKYGTFTNTAVVGSDDNHNPPEKSRDTDTVVVPYPPGGISITKAGPADPVRPGDPITFTIHVHNTGDADLTGVRVTDSRYPGCAKTFATLALDETETYTCKVTAATEDMTNTATVTGTAPGGPVTDRDTAVVNVVEPSVHISKKPDQSEVFEGDTVSYTIIVTNTGDTPLKNVRVTDGSYPQCGRTVPDLPVGDEEYRYQCEVKAGKDDLFNRATVVGTPTVGPDGTVRDTADARVIVLNKGEVAGLRIDKTADRKVVRPGDPITYTITVRNTGEVVLTNVKIDDDVAPGCHFSLGRLDPGERRSRTCTSKAPYFDVVNIATATGRPPSGGSVDVTSDPVWVKVVHPGITVLKDTDAVRVRPGDPVTYQITVVNTGDVALRGVKVDDPSYGRCGFTVPGTLAPGARHTRSCTITAPSAEFTNTVNTSGTPAEGPGTPVKDSDSRLVGIDDPAVKVLKSVQPRVARRGDPVTYTFTVINSGDVKLTDVEIQDAVLPSCHFQAGTLAVGARKTFTCQIVAPRRDLVNTATGTGIPPAGPPVTGVSDPVKLKIIHPRLRVTKKADRHRGPVRRGRVVRFTVTVRNTGDVPLTGVRISDTVAPGCARRFPSLAVGAVRTVRCTAKARTDPLVNIATVTGQPPIGSPVTGSGRAVVQVKRRKPKVK